MPTYRSITLSLISQYDFQSIPEYHLPSDDPSPPIGISDPNSKIHGDPKEAYSPADDSNHSIGVCAPIFPNSQFWLSFDAVRPAFPTEYYFFKFFVDGKHFNSWGIGEESDWRGKMVFGLFANKYDQIERRNLTFGSGVGLSGMIEVKVFRCFGRKRINAHLNCLTEAKSGRQRPAQKEKRAVKTQYELAGLLKRRDQDMRGVKFTHGGIIKPQYHHPLLYYKYELIDPITCPFATFRYFLRTWDQLEVLYTAPPDSETTEPGHESDSPYTSDSELQNPAPFQNVSFNAMTPQSATGNLSRPSISDTNTGDGTTAPPFPPVFPPPHILPSSAETTSPPLTQNASHSDPNKPTPTPQTTAKCLPNPSPRGEFERIRITAPTPPPPDIILLPLSISTTLQPLPSSRGTHLTPTTDKEPRTRIPSRGKVRLEFLKEVIGKAKRRICRR